MICKKLILVFFLTLFISTFASAQATKAKIASPQENPWSKKLDPLTADVEAFGGYTGGCYQGGVSLLPDEGDFHIMRKSRRRFYGQPVMQKFVKKLGKQVKDKKFGKLLMGDLGQARGGPMLNGHSSHQIGLDGDFWFWFDSPGIKRTITKKEEEGMSAISMINSKKLTIRKDRFFAKHVAMLKFAAAQPEVARIFVNPVIKRELCKQTKNAEWLGKVRPWWGHHYHFHVRLKCPEGQSNCRPQGPTPKKSDCGANLTWWFSQEAKDKLAEAIAKDRGKSAADRLAAKLGKVPEACHDVLTKKN